MRLTGTGVLAVAALGLLAMGALTVYAKRADIAKALNPSSGDNLASQAVGGFVEDITEGRETTLGGALARVREWASGDDAAIEAMKRGAPVRADGSIVSVEDYYSFGAGA